MLPRVAPQDERQFSETLLPLMTTSLDPWMVILAPLLIVMSPLLLSVMLALPEVTVIWSPAEIASFLPMSRVSPLLTLTREVAAHRHALVLRHAQRHPAAHADRLILADVDALILPDAEGLVAAHGD